MGVNVEAKIQFLKDGSWVDVGPFFWVEKLVWTPEPRIRTTEVAQRRDALSGDLAKTRDGHRGYPLDGSDEDPDDVYPIKTWFTFGELLLDVDALSESRSDSWDVCLNMLRRSDVNPNEVRFVVRAK